MLILTRRVGESIYIGKEIKVICLGFTGKQVRIGLEAPDDVVILREEVKLRDEQSDSIEKKLDKLVSNYAQRKTV